MLHSSSGDLQDLRQDVAAIAKELATVKSMLFTLSNLASAPRPSSGASTAMRSGPMRAHGRRAHVSHKERADGAAVLGSVETFANHSDDELSSRGCSSHATSPTSNPLAAPRRLSVQIAQIESIDSASKRPALTSPAAKPSDEIEVITPIDSFTGTATEPVVRKRSSRVLARADESSSPSADTGVSVEQQPAPQVNFTGTMKPAADASPPVRRVGLHGEDTLIVLSDVLFMLSVTVTWVGAIFYTINGLNGPEAELATTFVGLLVISQVYRWIWIGTRFFVQERRGDWEVLETLTDIRQNYLSFWFKFDVFLAIPFDWILLGWQNQLFFYCQLRHILSVVRFVNITTGSNPLVERLGLVRLLAPLLVMICLIHAAASVVCALNQFDYIPALYWSAVTMSSVGYGDKNATDDRRRIFGICVIVLGVALVTAVTAVATSMLTVQDSVKMSVDAKKRLLNSMMNHYHVPWAVQLEVIGAFPTALEHGNEEQFKTLIENMPPFIVEKLTTYIRAKVVSDAIPLFQKCPAEVLLNVASRLVHRFVQANEAIVTVGEEGTEMYFLVRGVAEVEIELPDGSTAIVATLRSGTFFGEIALVTENCRRTASVYAEVLCELLVLNKIDFEDLAAQYSEVKEFFGKVIEEAANRAKASGNKKKTS